MTEMSWTASRMNIRLLRQRLSPGPTPATDSARLPPAASQVLRWSVLRHPNGGTLTCTITLVNSSPGDFASKTPRQFCRRGEGESVRPDQPLAGSHGEGANG